MRRTLRSLVSTSVLLFEVKTKCFQLWSKTTSLQRLETSVSYRSQKQRVSTQKKHKKTNLETNIVEVRHVLTLKPFSLGSPVHFECVCGAWIALQKWRISDVESMTPPHVENEWLGGTTTPFRLLSTRCIIISPMSCIAPNTCGLGTTPIRKSKPSKCKRIGTWNRAPKRIGPPTITWGNYAWAPPIGLELGGHVFIRKSLGSDEVCGWISGCHWDTAT